MPDPHELTIAQAADQVRQGSLSPVALAQSLLGRIDALEPRLHAWITLDREDVLGQARELEQELAQKGPRGPLHGIPVGIKDIYYTAGMKTTAASKVYADFVPDVDATTVRKLKEAGAIMLGKAMTTEFATSDPSPAVNPWNPRHTAGGSSSGSCVAVASRMCPVALGSQTAGSTVRPAAYNGIVGLKGTSGRVSRYGIVALSWSMDTVGILTRTVEDAAIVLGVLAGHDPNDPSSSTEPVPDYRQALNSLKGAPRIGLVREFFYQRANQEMRDHTDDVAQRLARAGAKVEEAKLPASFATAQAVHRVISNVETAAYHEEMFRDHAEEYQPRIRSAIEVGMLLPGVRYLQAQRLRRQIRRDLDQLASRYDALLTPVAPSEAPASRNTTGDPILQIPWTMAGLPAISVPSGLARSGLPLGIQLVADSFQESRLLAVARWCEATLGFNHQPPDLE